VVYRAKRKADGVPCVLKRISRPIPTGGGGGGGSAGGSAEAEAEATKEYERCFKEVRLLQQLEHPNIIRYLDCMTHTWGGGADEKNGTACVNQCGEELVLVLEFAPNGDLKQRLDKLRAKTFGRATTAAAAAAAPPACIGGGGGGGGGGGDGGDGGPSTNTSPSGSASGDGGGSAGGRRGGDGGRDRASDSFATAAAAAEAAAQAAAAALATGRVAQATHAREAEAVQQVQRGVLGPLSCNRLDEGKIWRYFTSLCKAVSHMHSRRVLHRDLKPANILFGARDKLKVGDLGLGRSMQEDTLLAHSKVGTPYYMAPQVIRGEPYDHKCDVWSMGCLLYELAALRSPFKAKGLDLFALIQRISTAEYPPLPCHYSRELRQLVTRMLSLEAADRPDMKAVLRVAKDARNRWNSGGHDGGNSGGGSGGGAGGVGEGASLSPAAAAAAAAAGAGGAARCRTMPAAVHARIRAFLGGQSCGSGNGSDNGNGSGSGGASAAAAEAAAAEAALCALQPLFAPPVPLCPRPPRSRVGSRAGSRGSSRGGCNIGGGGGANRILRGCGARAVPASAPPAAATTASAAATAAAEPEPGTPGETETGADEQMEMAAAQVLVRCWITTAAAQAVAGGGGGAVCRVAESIQNR
jgi:hypothetical protein